MNKTAEERSHFHLMCELIVDVSCLKLCKAKVDNSSQAVQRSVTDSTDDLAEMWSVKCDMAVINIIEQNPISALFSGRNFQNSMCWMSVFMPHPDLHFVPVIACSQTVRDSQDVGWCFSFCRSQDLHHRSNEALIIWNDGVRVRQASPDLHQISSLGTVCCDVELNIRLVSLETDFFSIGNCSHVSPAIPHGCHCTGSVKWDDVFQTCEKWHSESWSTGKLSSWHYFCSSFWAFEIMVVSGFFSQWKGVKLSNCFDFAALKNCFREENATVLMYIENFVVQSKETFCLFKVSQQFFSAQNSLFVTKRLLHASKFSILRVRQLFIAYLCPALTADGSRSVELANIWRSK